MMVILDERRSVPVRRNHPSGDSQRYSIDLQLLQLADFVCIVKDETYEVVKDRMTGETREFPIDELPELVKQRLVNDLKFRDEVSTDE